MIAVGRGKRAVLLAVLISICLYTSVRLFSSRIAGTAPFFDELSRGLEKIIGKESEYGGRGVEVQDAHPIKKLMSGADEAWESYDSHRSVSFRDTLKNYRRRYGRHPPPGFDDWYKYARERLVHNIDDFQQIHDDLRPFWAIEPKVLRSLAAHASDDLNHHLATVSIRNHTIYAERYEMWRSSEFINLISPFIQYLPDMDIPVNRMDQPRVVVPWEDMQAHLAKEVKTRNMTEEEETVAGFTEGMEGFFTHPSSNEEANADAEDWGWFGGGGKNYMNIAKLACPPESHARSEELPYDEVEKTYKSLKGGLITNFNLSSDLCTVGPQIQDKHGMLFAPSSISATHRLVPVFGECKVNVNSDILFPGNMYYMRDERYDYDPRFDLPWFEKKDAMVWRGATSGGFNREEDWRSLHRQRLILLLNSTEVAGKTVHILTEDPFSPEGNYTDSPYYHPSPFAAAHTDAGFTDLIACVPNGCGFYDDQVAIVNRISLAQTFDNKYVVDVDGHSFSGRWRAFLQSKSLGIKATIFREWHDSRLFAWRHFVPMDNRFDDVYTILTYFIGVNHTSAVPSWQSGEAGMAKFEAKANAGVRVQRHDYEAFKIAQQGREWAEKVLRREDIEIYTFRLLLEYGRLIDDNRACIGYGGDGSELDAFDAANALLL